MIPAPILLNEPQRLASLEATGILFSNTHDEKYDRITRLTSLILGVPIALVSLVGHDVQWFKSRIGLEPESTPRDISFCGHAIADDQFLIVNDTLADERFFDNPLVIKYPNIRFYAGCPIHTIDGFAMGTLCAIDRT